METKRGASIDVNSLSFAGAPFLVIARSIGARYRQPDLGHVQVRKDTRECAFVSPVARTSRAFSTHSLLSHALPTLNKAQATCIRTQHLSGYARMASTAPALSYCSAAALRMAARRVSQFYDAYLAPEGLKVSQYSVLAVAARGREKAPTVNELADELGMDRSTLGHNLRPLERDGLVALEGDPVDRRMRRVVVTELGRAKRRACRQLWAVAQRRFEKAFGASRTAELGDLLLCIARDLDLREVSDMSQSSAPEQSLDHVR